MPIRDGRTELPSLRMGISFHSTPKIIKVIPTVENNHRLYTAQVSYKLWWLLNDYTEKNIDKIAPNI